VTNDFELNEGDCELLDLYACGALDGSELEKAEKLLSSSFVAQEYVEESNAMFAQFEDNAESSSELLKNIKTQIHDDSHSNITPITSKHKSFFLPFVTGAVAASIFAIAIGVLTWPNSVDKQQSALSMETTMENFKSESETSFIELKDTKGQMGAEVMMHEKGDIMVDGRHLEELNENDTYQLWAVIETKTGQKVISAGILGNKPGVFMVQVHGNVKAFVITLEQSGGVEKSNKEPVYTAQVA